MGTFFQNGRRGDMTAARARNREESNLQGLPQTISNRINLPVKTIPLLIISRLNRLPVLHRDYGPCLGRR